MKDNSTTAINRIGSYEDRTTQCVNIINELMDNYKTQNKIDSTQYESRRGEVAEFQSLLRSLGKFAYTL